VGRVDGKVALITGGARGMGAEHARRLVGEGAKVVIGDVLDDEGQSVATELGDNALYLHLDVTQPEQWTSAVAEAVRRFGRLDVLVNNAGVAGRKTVRKFELERWRHTLDVNLTGTFLGTQAVVDEMIRSGKGSIINISSIEGLRGAPFAHAAPLGRPAEPIEVSNLVLYLASDESSYSTGSEFVVDGGVTADTPRKDLTS
jgi:3alpha(or 20beta)-hydroxysteroid dehydrogenase